MLVYCESSGCVMTLRVMRCSSINSFLVNVIKNRATEFISFRIVEANIYASGSVWINLDQGPHVSESLRASVHCWGAHRATYANLDESGGHSIAKFQENFE